MNLRELFTWTLSDKNDESVHFQQILISLLNRCGSKLNALHINTETDFIKLDTIYHYFPRLTVLSLDKIRLTVNCYRYIKEFSSLEEFTLTPQSSATKDVGIPENEHVINYLREAFNEWKCLKKFGFVTSSMAIVGLVVNLPSTVVDLFIGSMCITGIGCDALKTFFETHPNLKRLSLWTRNSNDFVDSLAANCRNLEMLNIYTKFVKPLDLSMFPNLTELSLPSLWQSNNNVKILHQILYSCCNLHILRLPLGRFCTIEPLPKIASLETVKTIDLSRTKTSKQFFQSLVQQCSHLTEIVLDLNEEDFQMDMLITQSFQLKRIVLKNDSKILYLFKALIKNLIFIRRI